MNRFILLLCLAAVLMISTRSYSQGSFAMPPIPPDSIAAGRIIDSIDIRTVDIGGATGNGIQDKLPGWLGTVLNSFHFTTEDWVVQNYLLFEEGEPYSNEDITETERLLRQTGFFYDAKVSPVHLGKDSLGVKVITKDKWTLTPDISYDSQTKEGYVLLKDQNFLGKGHFVQGGVTFSEDPEIGIGGKMRYLINNIRGSFVNLQGIANRNKRTSFYAVNIFRPFITDRIRWGGGVDFTWELGKLDFIDPDLNKQEVSYKLQNYDLWIGHTIKTHILSGLIGEKTRYTTAARIGYRKNSATEGNQPVDSDLFENSSHYFFSLGIINRKFITEKFVEGFGRTEDITKGTYINFTFGNDILGGDARHYAGMSMVYSEVIPWLGYFSLLSEIGGFRRKDVWEQNVFHLDFTAHTRRININGWTSRLFLQTDYLLGFDRFPGEQVYLNAEAGFRGITGENLFGTKRLITNMEHRFYTPFSLAGFSFGGILFIDLGLIGDHREELVNTRLYQSYGGGIRFINESIAQAAFEISAAYIPFVPGNNNNGDFTILFTGAIALESRDFRFDRPEVIKFGEAD